MKSQQAKKSVHTFKTKTWKEVVEKFSERTEADPAFQPILDFVTEVTNSRFAVGLFPTTSMHDIWIFQTENFEMYYESVVVKFDFSRKKFMFQYFETPYIKNSWKHECNVEDAFDTFEGLLELKKWFLEAPKEQLT